MLMKDVPWKPLSQGGTVCWICLTQCQQCGSAGWACHLWLAQSRRRSQCALQHRTHPEVGRVHVVLWLTLTTTPCCASHRWQLQSLHSHSLPTADLTRCLMIIPCLYACHQNDNKSSRKDVDNELRSLAHLLGMCGSISFLPGWLICASPNIPWHLTGWTSTWEAPNITLHLMAAITAVATKH